MEMRDLIRIVTEAESNTIDTVTLDIPLLIRLLEYSKEDAKTDMDLHNVAERLIELGNDGTTLSMDHYDQIVGSEMVSESISYDTTVRAIIAALGSPLSQLYSNLESAAQQYYDDHGDLDKFGLVAGGHAGRWVEQFYINKLQSELFDLAKYKSKYAGGLKDFLRQSHRSFSKIEKELPDILHKMARDINSKDLDHAVMSWKQFSNKYHNLIARLKLDSLDEPKSEKPKKSNIVGSQNSQVEEIINGILNNVPKDVAKELRPLIARSDNKLQLLMVELAKRGIKA